MKLFVMSDIHSFYDAMMSALEKNGFDINNPDHHIVICGDLFDRGPDAVKVFEFVQDIALKNRLTYIYGNHEELLQECVYEIVDQRNVSGHHISNGTLDTVMQFTGMGKYDLISPVPLDKAKFFNGIEPVLDFVYENAVDYAEFGEYIFVHGWVPCDSYNGKVAENWDTPEADWDGARWLNGMSAWHRGARLTDKTIVCGHYHSSWGHSHIRQDRKEFPQKNHVNWEKSFEPFIDEGIIAIDACTAYTGFVNCIVLEA